MERYKIYVVCGSGMATSRVIAEQAKVLLKERGLEADVIITNASDIGREENCDLILTSTLLSGNFKAPVVRTMSLLTGQGIEEDMDKIVAILKGSKA